MEKRHRRGLSKQGFLDSRFGFMVLICFWVIDSKIERAGGRAFEPQLAPPCGRKSTTSWGGAGGANTIRIIVMLVLLIGESASTVAPTRLSIQMDPDSRSARAVASAAGESGCPAHRVDGK